MASSITGPFLFSGEPRLSGTNIALVVVGGLVWVISLVLSLLFIILQLKYTNGRQAVGMLLFSVFNVCCLRNYGLPLSMVLTTRHDREYSYEVSSEMSCRWCCCRVEKWACS